MKKLISILVIFTLVVSAFIPLLNNVAAKDVNRETIQITDKKDNKDKRKELQKQYAVSEEFLQNELNAGYTLEEIGKALWLQKHEKMQYKDSIKKIKPEFINKSKEVESIVESEFDYDFINRFQIIDIEPNSDNSSKKNQVSISSIEEEEDPIDDIIARTSEAPYTVALINENVSTLSGNLQLQSTDLSLPGRNGIGFSLSRTYNSQDAQYYGKDYYTSSDYDYYVKFNSDVYTETVGLKVSVGMDLWIEEDYDYDGVPDNQVWQIRVADHYFDTIYYDLDSAIAKRDEANVPGYYQENYEWNDYVSGEGRWRYSTKSAYGADIVGGYNKIEYSYTTVLSVGVYSTFAEVLEAMDDINNSSGATIGYSSWTGSSSTGDSREIYIVSSNPNATYVQYLVSTEYYNKTVKSYNEKMYPIGTGWKWNISSIEFYNGKKYLHLPDGGSYEIDGSTLKGYPWQDLTFSNNNSVNVNGELSAYLLSSIQGIKQYFNSQGYLIKITDAYGNNIDFLYSNHAVYGKVLTSIVDAIGNQIDIAYSTEEVVLTQGTQQVVYKKVIQDGKELLSQVIDQEGRVTTYDYSIKAAKFNLLSTSTSSQAISNPYALIVGVTLPTGAKTVYQYEDIPINRYTGSNSVNQVYRIKNREEHNVFTDGTFEVKNVRSLTYQGDMSGFSGALYFSDTTFTTTLADGRKTTTYEFKRDYISSSIPIAYYNIKETTMAGTEQIITTNTFDETRRLPVPNDTAIQFKDGTEVSELITISRQLDNYGNILTETNPLGITTALQYDANSHLLTKITQPISDTQTLITEYTRYPEGKVHTQTVKNQTGEIKAYVEYLYDSYGNPTAINITDNGQIITNQIEYSPDYLNAYPTKTLKQVTDIDGLSSTITKQYSFNTSTGSLTEYTDGLGNKTLFQYDLLGRVKTITYPDLAAVQAAYDDLNNKIEVTDEIGIQTVQKWNSLGWLEQTGIIEDTIYKAKAKYGYDDFGRVIYSEDALGNRTDYLYDPWDQLAEINYSDANKTTYQLDSINNSKTTIDPEGNQIKQTFDKLNRLVKTEEIELSGEKLLNSLTYNYSGNILTSTDANGSQTAYQYDVLGQLQKVTDAKGQDTQYQYDQRGNLTKVTYSDGNTIEKAYDQIGRLIQKTDPKGQIEKFYYDANNNLTTQIDRKAQTINLQYDIRNRLTNKSAGIDSVSYEYSLNGQRTIMTDGTGTTQYFYNSIGLLATVQYPDARTITYDYNELGNRATMLDPFGEETNYSFDSMNRLSSLSLGEDPVNEIDYLFDNNGRIKSVSQRNGITTAFDYQGLNLTNLTQQTEGAVLNTYNFSYDNNRNITGINENGEEDTFTHDVLNRIETSSEFNEEYTYDERGNRQTLQTDQEPDFANAEYEYNPWNQLIQVTKEDGTIVSYTYNGDGLLYERTENGETTRYYYDGMQIIAEAIVSGGTATHKASYLRGLGLAARIDANGDKAYYLLNGHGDVVELRDESGNLLNEYTYDIWGKPLTINETIDNPFMYSGELWDDTTELQYLRARWYDPSIGRFISEDSYEGVISNPLTLNFYAYVANNPLKFIDPSGHEPMSELYKNGEWGYYGPEVEPFDVHEFLEFLGFLLDPADGLNAAIYAVEGYYEEAAWSAGSMIFFISLFKIGKNIFKGTSNVGELVLKGTNYSAEYAQKLQMTYKVFKSKGYDIGEHGLNRIFGRINQGKIKSIDQVFDVLENGTRYSDTVNGGTVLFKDGISIHIAEDGFIKTVIGDAKVKSTWELLK